jgi:hypothetical protein
MINIPDTPETWATIPDYEGRYEVSSLGRLYDNRQMKFIKLYVRKGFYTNIVVNDKGKSRWLSLHRAIVWAFTGIKSNRQRQVNHKDGEKSNNAISNLELVSQRENLIHAINTGLRGKGWRKNRNKTKVDN